MRNRKISEGRQLLYYFGMALTGVGLLVFLSVFFTAFSASPGDAGSIMTRAPVGMVLMIIGRGMMTVAARGLAGSGVILDPQRARKDIEPWSRMAGGIVDDALEDVDLGKTLGRKQVDDAAPVKIRCQSCRTLNDESDKFCGQCGAAL